MCTPNPTGETRVARLLSISAHMTMELRTVPDDNKKIKSTQQ